MGIVSNCWPVLQHICLLHSQVYVPHNQQFSPCMFFLYCFPNLRCACSYTTFSYQVWLPINHYNTNFPIASIYNHCNLLQLSMITILCCILTIQYNTCMHACTLCVVPSCPLELIIITKQNSKSLHLYSYEWYCTNLNQTAHEDYVMQKILKGVHLAAGCFI